jgi:hypothetical protein
MRGAIPPLPQYAFMEWCSVKKSTQTTLPLHYGLDDQGSRVRFPTGLGILLFTTASRTALGPTQPPIQWVPGAFSLGVKWPGREVDHSPPSRAEVKEWGELYLQSFLQYAFMALCSAKSRGITSPLLVCFRISHRREGATSSSSQSKINNGRPNFASHYRSLYCGKYLNEASFFYLGFIEIKQAIS